MPSSRSSPTPAAGPTRPLPDLARDIARLERLTQAAVGLLSGPLLYAFVRTVLWRSDPPAIVAVAVVTAALAMVGRAHEGYFRLRDWEIGRGGRVYERVFFNRHFKR